MAYTDILRGLREDRDLKQVDVAEAIGLRQQHYSKYETGENEMPIRILEVLADYYGVSTDYILGRTRCKEGVAGINAKLAPDVTVGTLITNILSLTKPSQASVIEYVGLQQIKEKCQNKKRQ